MPTRYTDVAPPEYQSLVDNDQAVQKARQDLLAWMRTQGVTDLNDLHTNPATAGQYRQLMDALNEAIYTATKGATGHGGAVAGYSLDPTTGQLRKTGSKATALDYITPLIPGATGLYGSLANAANGGKDALTLSQIENGAPGLPASTVAALPGAATVAPTVASRLWDYLKKNGPALGAAVGEATQGAANRDQNNNNNLANAAEINRRATNDYQTSLQNLSQQERDQRASDVTNLRRQSFAQHPIVSPFDPTGGPHYSDSYMQGLSDIEKQALTRLHQPPTYDPTNIAPTKPTPYVPNTSVGTGRTVGNWLSTILGLL